MSYLPILTRSLRGITIGSHVCIDDFRWEFEAAQIPDPAHGAVFGEAVAKGYLVPVGVRKTRHRAGKGRLVRVYRITGKAQREARRAAA